MITGVIFQNKVKTILNHSSCFPFSLEFTVPGFFFAREDFSMWLVKEE